MEKRVPTSEKVNSLIKVAKVYLETAEKSEVILWTGSAVTTAGLATVYLTDNGLETGNAIFTNIFSIQATAEPAPGASMRPMAPGGNAEAVPLTGVHSLSADKKTLSVEVIVAASPKALFAPDGTAVYILVVGD